MRCGNGPAAEAGGLDDSGTGGNWPKAGIPGKGERAAANCDDGSPSEHTVRGNCACGVAGTANGGVPKAAYRGVGTGGRESEKQIFPGNIRVIGPAGAASGGFREEFGAKSTHIPG